MAQEQLACTVISLLPFEVKEDKPGLIPSRYHISAAKPGKPATLVVHQAKHYVYLDETRGSLQVRDSPDEVARSIAEDFISAQIQTSPDSKPGIFWVVGDVSKRLSEVQDLIDQHQQLQDSWFVAICRLADEDWKKYEKPNAVSSIQRMAARAIGWRPEEHPWMSREAVNIVTACPACNTGVPAGTVICPQCRCVLDQEKYKSLQFASV